jgi:PhzF family phenazine biosynthesis protein
LLDSAHGRYPTAVPAPLFHVDAFASEPFRGNPAAVCLLPAARDLEWMQAMAAELSLPATAFVTPATDGLHGLRWFTAVAELGFCGHGTLASAHALWESGRLAGDAVARFATAAGVLAAARREGWIETDFPAQPATQTSAPPGLADALGVRPRWVGRNRLDYVVEVDDETTLRGITPDFAALAAIDTRGVAVTCAADSPPFDFVSRFFAPRVGLPEDSATGSAHCALGPLWASRLGRAALTAYQASARGAVLRVTVAGERVTLAGQAVTVSRGELL